MSGGFGSSDQVTRRITDLERMVRANGASVASIASFGTFSLNSGATSTTKTDANVSASSLIFFVPSNAGGWSLDGALNGITPAAGSFSVSHQNSTLARSYNYIVINPV